MEQSSIIHVAINEMRTFTVTFYAQCFAYIRWHMAHTLLTENWVNGGIDLFVSPVINRKASSRQRNASSWKTAILISEVGDGSATRFLSAAKLHVYDQSLKLRVQRSVTVMAEG